MKCVRSDAPLDLTFKNSSIMYCEIVHDDLKPDQETPTKMPQDQKR